MFRYSEECLFRTSQEERDWRSELSNHSTSSKSIDKTVILLGQWQILKEPCSEMTFSREMR
jgi:hypothetical protein